MKPPTSLHISFVGGTSPTTAIKQSISNINITLPYSPNLPDAAADDICKTLNNSSSFSVLDDALGYNNNIYTTTNPPIGRRSYIDLTSFKFQTYNSATSQYTYTDNPYVCTTDAGKYTYNPSTGNVIFVPSAGAASLDQDFIYYNVKNKKPTDTSLEVLSTDEYRSRTAKTTINLTSTDCQPMPNIYVKINK